MANYLDKACRYLAKQEPISFIYWLFGYIQLAPLFHIWLDSRRLALPDQGDLTNDLVARLEHLAESGQFFDAAIVRLDDQTVAGQVEQNIERAASMIHRWRFEPARGDEQRCVPPLIDQRRCRDAHLADDLRPQLQRVAGLAPR